MSPTHSKRRDLHEHYGKMRLREQCHAEGHMAPRPATMPLQDGRFAHSREPQRAFCHPGGGNGFGGPWGWSFRLDWPLPRGVGVGEAWVAYRAHKLRSGCSEWGKNKATLSRGNENKLPPKWNMNMKVDKKCGLYRVVVSLLCILVNRFCVSCRYIRQVKKRVNCVFALSFLRLTQYNWPR